MNLLTCGQWLADDRRRIYYWQILESEQLTKLCVSDIAHTFQTLAPSLGISDKNNYRRR